MASRQYEWAQKQAAIGRCAGCGKRRGRNGTARHCRSCADKRNANLRERIRKAKEGNDA